MQFCLLHFFDSQAFPPDARDLIERLLHPNPSLRLGNLKEGPQGIRDHVWYERFNWDRLESKKLEAPYMPPIRDALDTSNFDDYEEDDRVMPYRDDGKGWFDSF